MLLLSKHTWYEIGWWILRHINWHYHFFLNLIKFWYKFCVGNYKDCEPSIFLFDENQSNFYKFCTRNHQFAKDCIKSELIYILPFSSASKTFALIKWINVMHQAYDARKGTLCKAILSNESQKQNTNISSNKNINNLSAYQHYLCIVAKKLTRFDVKRCMQWWSKKSCS